MIEFFKYIDLGVTDASIGHMRVQKTSATAGLSQPTGWHYHSVVSSLKQGDQQSRPTVPPAAPQTGL